MECASRHAPIAAGFWNGRAEILWRVLRANKIGIAPGCLFEKNIGVERDVVYASVTGDKGNGKNRGPA